MQLKKEIPNNENPEKVINIVEEIFNFDKQQKGKRLPLNFERANLKILNPKQILQRLPISLAQVQASNTSETLQIIYSLYRAKEITKKVYNNIMNSIKV